MTQPEPESCTSKFPKKLARDIYLSSDIGRSSPFDPFAGADISKMYAENSTKRNTGSGRLMYFAAKPLRNTKGAVSFAKMSNSDSAGPKKFPTMTDATYNSTIPSTTKDVSFTGAKRFANDPPLPQKGGDRTASTPAGTRRSSPMNYYGAVSGKSGRTSAGTPVTTSDILGQGKPSTPFSMSRTVRSTFEPKGVIEKIDSKGAPTLGPRSGPKVPPPFKPKSSKQPAHPWEQKGAAAAMRRAVGEAHSVARRRSSSSSAPPPQTPQPDSNATQGEQQASSPTAMGDSSPNVASSSNVGNNTSVMSPHGSMSRAKQQQSSASLKQVTVQEPTSQNIIETDDDWNREHKSVIARYGLVAGVGRKERLKKKAKPKGADFSNTTGRHDAPTTFLVPNQQFSDKIYDAKHEVTTKDRKRAANVKLGGYASRRAEEAPHLVTANKVMSLNHILKFHEKQLKRERESALALPDVEYNDKGRPMTAADDFASMPSSLYAPTSSLTRKYRGVPDMSLYADRHDEPLSSLLGGDPKKYYRQVKKEMEAEEAELKRQDEEDYNEAMSMLDF